MDQLAKQISEIVAKHTRPEDLEHHTKGEFVDHSRVRVIVEMEMWIRQTDSEPWFVMVPVFRGTEFRVREDNGK
jgi:hypothetical protein